MPTANTSKPLHEELQLLSHAVEGDTFHFVVVQWAHYSLIQKTKDYLRQQFPERPASSLHVKGISYESLMAEILTQAKGFIFLDDFENLLTDPDLYVAFNQRRGKLARFPLSIVAFIPPSERYVTQLAKAIPDWWSVLTFLATLENTESQIVHQHISFQEPSITSTLGGPYQEDRLTEIARLRKRITEIEVLPENTSLLNQLYTQALELCETAGLYQLGIETANEWLKIAFALDYEKSDPSAYTHLLDRIGIFEQSLGHYDRARSLLERALTLDLKNLGAEHPSVATRQSNLALVYDDLGDYDKARDLLESALASDLKNLGPEHPTVANRQSNLAAVYRDLGDYEKARDLLEYALTSYLKNLGAEHPNVATVQSNLAAVYSDLGDYAKALDLLESALASDLKNFGAEHPSVANRQNNLAHVFLDMGENAKARDLFGQAYAIWKKTLGDKHPNTQQVKHYLDNL